MFKRLCAVLILVTVFAADADAQIRASERGAVSQTIDGTTITIDYGRPQARGRDDLWGGVTPWGKVWTPGANWATTVETSRDITINGHELAAGKYSVWFEVQPEEWTVILDPQPRRFHLMPPAESTDQVRFPIRPGTGPHVEMLTWSFPAAGPTGGTVQMAWGDATATFDIGVHPSQPITVAPNVAERYVGSYTFALEEPLGGQTVKFEITYENARLVGHWENPPLPRLGLIWLAPPGGGDVQHGGAGRRRDLRHRQRRGFRVHSPRRAGEQVRVPGDRRPALGIGGAHPIGSRNTESDLRVL